MEAKRLEALNQTEPVADVFEDDIDTVYTRPLTITDAIYRHVLTGECDETVLKDNIHMMLFAGNDTSSVAMSHALVMLAIHQDIQERVVDEVNRVLINTPIDAPLAYETLEQLTYMERVLRETLRLYPVGPYLARECTEDTKISKCVVPAGASVIVSIYSLHRRSDVWGADADKFDPDRFEPSRLESMPPASFVAFSRGARDCLGINLTISPFHRTHSQLISIILLIAGIKYAFVSMKIVLASLLRKYKFNTTIRMEDINLVFEVTMRMTGGAMVSVEKRL